jgi:hypothetical protein
MKRFLGILLALFAGAVPAQQVPLGLPQPEKSPRDTEFGVVSRQFGLERRVEMYQWRAAGQGYEKVWSAEPIASAAFASGHDNPKVLPLASRRILAPRAMLDGRPLDPEVIARLGEWRAFRPNFSALPDNLSATFQPEGDGLGSAENPLAPRIGDLRVTWRELTLPALDAKVELRNGVWRLRSPTDIASATQPGMPASSVNRSVLGWLIGAGIFALMLFVAITLLRNRRR